MDKLAVPMIYVLAFVAVFLVIQTVAGLAFASSDQTKRVNRRLTMLAQGMRPDDVYAALVRSPAALAGQNGALNRFYDALLMRLRRAGFTDSPVRFLSYVFMIAVGLWLVAMALTTLKNPAGFLTNALFSLLGAAILAGLAAWVWLDNRCKARLKKIEEQLPLALDIVTRAIRAGHPVISAVQLASAELGDPIGSEFGLIVDETTYGLEFRDALTSFARRTGSSDAHFFAVSVGIQSETGGNLAEILEGLANVIRGRQTLGKRIKALASEGKASAAILSILPLFLVGLMLLFQPKFYTDKFSDPIFWPVVVVIMIIYVIGQIMIKRIINISY